MAEIRVSPDGTPGAAATAVPRPGERVPAPTASEPSLGELFRQLATETTTLVKQEIALAKTELVQVAVRAAMDATGLVVAAVVALIGVLALVAAAIIGLGVLLHNYWLSALLIGALMLIVGGVMAVGFLNKLKDLDYGLSTTTQTLKQDKTWAQAEVQSVKRDLTS